MSHPHCSCPCHRGVDIQELTPCCNQIGIHEDELMPDELAAHPDPITGTKGTFTVGSVELTRRGDLLHARLIDS